MDMSVALRAAIEKVGMQLYDVCGNGTLQFVDYGVMADNTCIPYIRKCYKIPFIEVFLPLYNEVINVIRCRRRWFGGDAKYGSRTLTSEHFENPLTSEYFYWRETFI